MNVIVFWVIFVSTVSFVMGGAAGYFIGQGFGWVRGLRDSIRLPETVKGLQHPCAETVSSTTAPFRVIESTSLGNRYMVVDDRGDAECGNWFIASTWFREHADFIADCFAAKLEAHPFHEMPTYVRPDEVYADCGYRRGEGENAMPAPTGLNETQFAPGLTERLLQRAAAIELVDDMAPRLSERVRADLTAANVGVGAAKSYADAVNEMKSTGKSPS